MRDLKSVACGMSERVRKFRFVAMGLLAAAFAHGQEPVEESGGVVVIEAEDFAKQEHTDERRWERVSADDTPIVGPDGDPKHLEGAGGGVYLELLPDTRRTHDDKLVHGANFTEEAGAMAVLSYPVRFETPGTYWIWARVFSTGTEDNGLHFGINGSWPDSARRWQTTVKDRWHWESRQRTEEVHTGVPGILTLEVPEAGDHVIQVAMREDGAELDRILLVNRRDFHPEQLERGADGDGSVRIRGERRQWHKVTLDLDGPFAREGDESPNPFRDLSFEVRFHHESGSPDYRVPGYFAADGEAGESGAEEGTTWRAHLSPDKPGRWHYETLFHRGEGAALAAGDPEGEEVEGFHGVRGSFEVGASQAVAPDFRARGRLRPGAGRYPEFAGDGSVFLKVGADAPETLLAYEDFDNTRAENPDKGPLKSWEPHRRDWRPGDPEWRDGKGRGLIGALNYLSGQGMNAFSFLPYNAGGDGDNVWPFIDRDDPLHYDCSKLDQWGIVFDHATTRGLFLHFKLQETENDDEDGPGADQALDGGDLGVERKLYLREMVARFGHALALNWNLGEENTQGFERQRAMGLWLREIDPYDHPVVLHTYPDQQDEVYRPHLGSDSVLDGLSLQNSTLGDCHRQTVKWTRLSEEAGRPWMVAFDEPGNATHGMPPDPDWPGMEELRDGAPSVGQVRRETLWGTLLGGGWGVEYYFGYKLPENDLNAEDWRSREASWGYARVALEFFREQRIPVREMSCRDELVGNPDHGNERYCFAKDGELYLVFLPKGGEAQLDLPAREFGLSWFNPRSGAMREAGTTDGALQAPDGNDWLAVVIAR